MGRPITEARHLEWRERFARYAASGLSVVRFCENERVSESNFYAWKRRLISLPTVAACSPARALPSTPASGDGVATGQRSVARRVEMLPSSVPASAARIGDFIQVPLSSGCETASMEVILADGTTIRLPAEQLAALEMTLKLVIAQGRYSPTSEVRHA